jgi:hypothetical protein
MLKKWQAFELGWPSKPDLVKKKNYVHMLDFLFIYLILAKRPMA